MATSLQEANSIECRICHSETTRDLIRSPCLCKGSMGFVHTGCLAHWLNISSHTFCDLCSYKFEVITVRRYTLLQSIRAYLWRERQSLYMALLASLYVALLAAIFFLGIVILSLLLVEFIKVILSFIKNETVDTNDKDQDDGIIPPWIVEFVWIPVFAVLLKHCCFGGCKLIKRIYLAWYRFWNETVNVQLVLDLQNYKIIDNIDKLNIQNTELDEETEKSDQESLHEIKIAEKQSESKDNTITYFSILPEAYTNEKNADWKLNVENFNISMRDQQSCENLSHDIKIFYNPENVISHGILPGNNTRKTLNEEELKDFPFNNVKDSSKSSQECVPDDKESYSKIESRPLHSSSNGVLIIPEVHISHERKTINNFTDE